MDKTRKIIPIGGGQMRFGETREIDRFIVEQSVVKSPKVLFDSTASNDMEEYCKSFKIEYEELGAEVDFIKLLSTEDISEVETKILSANILYVGGGNYDLLFNAWVNRGVVDIVKKAYQNGLILCGLSAGCGIWFEKLIDKDKPIGERLTKGLGFLRGGCVPHYENENDYLQEGLDNQKIVSLRNGEAVFYEDEKLTRQIN